MEQKKVFLSSEGNAWYERNINRLNENELSSDIVLKSMKAIDISSPARILEIGCSDGSRLNLYKKMFNNSECYGIDPSEEAVNSGVEKYNLKLKVGTADHLPFEDNYFDIILFGFSLYLCDRKDLFKIAYEADRCLCNKGYIILKDFQPPFPYKNNYVHYQGISSFKMDYSLLFKWNPIYTEIYRIITDHNEIKQTDIPDDRIGVTILHKNDEYAYPNVIKWN